jgi:phage terminase small subunit
MSLTAKQEAFCLAYIETGNASEAYRKSYDAENMKSETIHKRASELLDNGEVAGRVEELRKEAAERNKITVDDLIKELQEAREAALGAANPQSAAAVAATMGKAKLLGMLVDKVDANVTTRELPASIDDFV